MSVTQFSKYFVNAIRLQKFMGFVDTDWIELRPITLLFGRNSAGKSALIRALLVLKQSMRNADSDSPLVLSGPLIDLGTYHNAVNNHSSSLSDDITFGFQVVHSDWKEHGVFKNDPYNEYEQNNEEFGETKKMLSSWSEIKNESVDYQKFELGISFGLLTPRGNPYLKSVSIFGYNDQRRILIFQTSYNAEDRIWSQLKSDAPLDYNIQISKIIDGIAVFDDVTNKPILETISVTQFTDDLWKATNFAFVNSIVPKLTPSHKADAKYKDYPPDWRLVGDILHFFGQTIDVFLNGLDYLPPLRSEARRAYSFSEAWTQKLASKELKPKIIEWLAKMELGASIETMPFSLDEGIIGIYIKENLLKTNLRDNGSGVAQVLPIIASLLTPQNSKLTIIEQPELHLHPQAQQVLANLFVDYVENGGRLLIETHSEHIFYKLRQLLFPFPSNANISSKANLHDFSLVFVTRKDNQSFIKCVNLDADGKLINPPPELRYFFGYNEEIRLKLEMDIRMRLKKGLQECFNTEDELKTLCFDLNFEAGDALARNTISGKIECLIEFAKRNQLTSELLNKCLKERPNYDW